MKRIIISITDDIVSMLDDMVKDTGLPSRNMLIVQLIREGLNMTSFRRKKENE